MSGSAGAAGERSPTATRLLIRTRDGDKDHGHALNSRDFFLVNRIEGAAVPRHDRSLRAASSLLLMAATLMVQRRTAQQGAWDLRCHMGDCHRS
jgi:hypothetical protein